MTGMYRDRQVTEGGREVQRPAGRLGMKAERHTDTEGETPTGRYRDRHGCTVAEALTERQAHRQRVQRQTRYVGRQRGMKADPHQRQAGYRVRQGGTETWRDVQMQKSTHTLHRTRYPRVGIVPSGQNASF